MAYWFVACWFVASGTCPGRRLLARGLLVRCLLDRDLLVRCLLVRDLLVRCLLVCGLSIVWMPKCKHLLEGIEQPSATMLE